MKYNISILEQKYVLMVNDRSDLSRSVICLFVFVNILVVDNFHILHDTRILVDTDIVTSVCTEEDSIDRLRCRRAPFDLIETDMS